MSQKTDRQLLEEIHSWTEHLDKDQLVEFLRIAKEDHDAIKDIREDLDGNGKPGLKADMHLFKSLIWPVIVLVVSAAVAAWLDLVVW